MTLAAQSYGLLVLLAIAPGVVWVERRVKAWSQLRRGPPALQPYRDLRRLFAKQPLAPRGASPLFLLAPLVGSGALVAAGLTLPLGSPSDGWGGAASLLLLGLLLGLHRFLMAAQAYDTGTPFGGLGGSRELFLGGLGEPILLLAAATIFVQTGTARVPGAHLPTSDPATWLVAASLAILWVAEAARIPFDNPATHLELTMVHEAMILEPSGWVLAVHEWGAAFKQTLLGGLLVLVLVPLPASDPLRITVLALLILASSGLLAALEAATVKVRLFRASHLLLLGAFLAFLSAAVALTQEGI